MAVMMRIDPPDLSTAAKSPIDEQLHCVEILERALCTDGAVVSHGGGPVQLGE
jgi:hypothetical protein